MKLHLYILFILSASIPTLVSAQNSTVDESSYRYSVQININRAGISGVCMMREVSDNVLGAIINEFGLSMLSFNYDPDRKRARIVDIAPQLDKWYIKKVLRRDLKKIIPQITQKDIKEVFRYCNVKQQIEYIFTPQIE